MIVSDTQRNPTVTFTHTHKDPPIPFAQYEMSVAVLTTHRPKRRKYGASVGAGGSALCMAYHYAHCSVYGVSLCTLFSVWRIIMHTVQSLTR